MEKYVFFKKADIVLITLLILICFALFAPRIFPQDTALTAVIYKNGQEVRRIELEGVQQSYKVDLHTSPDAVLLVDKNKIRYIHAGCNDKLCINSGWLQKAGDVSACLPSKTFVVVEGKPSGSVPDAVAY
ncbi:MAG: NusG domain II-containing protein [Oscillospiraceae bacterium]|jgi:hypothetical protein|nr:NusG domain II-containing protein [Oscillospiraceae bacterium]